MAIYIKSPQISRTLLSILTDLNNIVVWMVSTCPFNTNSSSPNVFSTSANTVGLSLDSK